MKCSESHLNHLILDQSEFKNGKIYIFEFYCVVEINEGIIW